MSQVPQMPEPAKGSDAELPQGPPFVMKLPDDPASGAEWYLWAGVLALLALVAFWPSVNGSFLWDDDHMLFFVRGLWHIWIPKIETIQYYPLTYTTFWIERHFWGNSPLGYRVVNLLLHAGGAVVLWRVLRRLSLPAAWAAAALWAVHPLQAESVCWISERKNVLSGLLALGSVLFYLDFAGLRDPHCESRLWRLPEQWHTYAISLGLFILAMFAKTVVCCVPVVLLLVLWWKRRLKAPAAAGLAPMLVIGAALAAVTSHFETNPQGLVQATGPQWALSFSQRLLVAGRAFWFYAAKLAWPIHQSFNYPRVAPNTTDVGQWMFVLAAAVVLVVLAVAVKIIGRGPLVAVLCYAAALFPSMGFFNVYPFRYSFVADHFQYLAGISLIALVTAIGMGLLRSWPQNWRAGAAAALLLVLGATAWTRAQVFVSSTALWEDTLKPGKNPNSWLAAFNLGKARFNEARDLFEQSNQDARGGERGEAQNAANDAMARLDDADDLMHRVLGNAAAPDEILGWAHLQLALDEISRIRSPFARNPQWISKAETEAERALQYEKENEATHPDGEPYQVMGEIQMLEAEMIGPENAAEPATLPATTRPATARERQISDKLRQAIAYDSQAMQVAARATRSPATVLDALDVYGAAALERGNADWQLAKISVLRGDHAAEDKYYADAIAAYQESLQINPDNVMGQFRLALCLEYFGQWELAKDHLITIVSSLDPYHNNAAAYNELGRVILESGTTNVNEFVLAMQCFSDALKMDPHFEDARRNLAMARKMIATTRPTTAPATRPATMPAPPAPPVR